MRTIRSDRTDQRELMERVVASFERLVALTSATHTDDLLALDITMQQAKALHVIAADPGIGVTALASRLGVGMSTASGSVDRLAEMGLIERDHDRHDRRHVMLTLTDEGRLVVDRFREVGVTILRQHLPHLHAAELLGLQTGIDGLVRVMAARVPPPPIDQGASDTP